MDATEYKRLNAIANAILEGSRFAVTPDGEHMLVIVTAPDGTRMCAPYRYGKPVPIRCGTEEQNALGVVAAAFELCDMLGVQP